MLNEHDDAADATQETFLQVFRSIDTFRGEAKFSTWLHHRAPQRIGCPSIAQTIGLAPCPSCLTGKPDLRPIPFLTGMK